MTPISAVEAVVRNTGPVTQEELALGPFAHVQPDTVPGIYRWTETLNDGRSKVGTITLATNGTFDFDGETSGSYRWHIHPQGLMVSWRKGIILFTKGGGPGVYYSMKEHGDSVRIEKEQ